MTDKTPPMPREKQWTVNSANRRKAIRENGGRQLLVMVQPDDNKMLNEIIAKRTKSDPGFNLTNWVARMIRRDYSELKRVRRPTGAKAGGPKG